MDVERSWACLPEIGHALFAAVENNDVEQFRNLVGLSYSDSESRDVFDRSLIRLAIARTVGGGKEETITLLHYAVCLTPLRKGVITLIAEADPTLLQRRSSQRNEYPAHFATAVGNLPALDLLSRLSERLLGSKSEVLSQTTISNDNDGSTVAHYACAFDKPLILVYLSQASPELLVKVNKKGLTPFHIATRCFSERSLLYLSKWFASRLSDVSLYDQLFKEDMRGVHVLHMLHRFWKSGSQLILMDLSERLVEENIDDAAFNIFWQTTQFGRWYKRSQTLCPTACCQRRLWKSGRRSAMILPLLLVVFAIILSFVGVFYWPNSSVAIYESGGSSQFFTWGLSTFVLISSLVAMQYHGPGRVAIDQNMHDSFHREVKDRPEDGGGTVEKSVLAGIVASSATAQTLFSSDLCPFCEIRRPRTHHGLQTEHCFTCGFCVEGLDHHCPWSGSCIGRNNIWTFRCFLIATMATVVSYVRLYAAFRSPHCNSSNTTLWCVLNGSLVHSMILLFFYLPLFLFAGAISFTQLRLIQMGTTMVGKARQENIDNVRNMKLCGGTGNR